MPLPWIAVNRRLMLLVPAFAMVIAGCKDPEPPPMAFEQTIPDDPATPGVGSAWMDPAVARGQAEWVPFRQPDAAPAAEPVAAEDGEAAGGSDVEAEVRGLIAEYGEIAADRDVEAMLDFHVPDQVEGVRALLESNFAMLGKIEVLTEKLKEKLPDSAERIDALAGKVADAATQPLGVGELTVVSEAEVTGEVSKGGLVGDVKFVLVDGEWYIEFVELPPAEQIKQMVGAVVGQFDMLLEGVSSGSIPADQVLMMLEQQVAAQTGMAPAEEQPAEPAEGEEAGG